TAHHVDLTPFPTRRSSDLHYQPLNVTEPASFAALGERIGSPQQLAIFLSTAPSLFEPTIRGLESAGLTGERARIGLEKPLGIDLATSCEINDAVASAFPESRIFRIDRKSTRLNSSHVQISYAV